jgi:hypothetical protein
MQRCADACQAQVAVSCTVARTECCVAALRCVLSDACIKMDGGWMEETRQMTPQWSSSFGPGTDKHTPLPRATAPFSLN